MRDTINISGSDQRKFLIIRFYFSYYELIVKYPVFWAFDEETGLKSKVPHLPHFQKITWG